MVYRYIYDLQANEEIWILSIFLRCYLTFPSCDVDRGSYHHIRSLLRNYIYTYIYMGWVCVCVYIYFLIGINVSGYAFLREPSVASFSDRCFFVFFFRVVKFKRGFYLC